MDIFFVAEPVNFQFFLWLIAVILSTRVHTFYHVMSGWCWGWRDDSRQRVRHKAEVSSGTAAQHGPH